MMELESQIYTHVMRWTAQGQSPVSWEHATEVQGDSPAPFLLSPHEIREKNTQQKNVPFLIQVLLSQRQVPLQHSRKLTFVLQLTQKLNLTQHSQSCKKSSHRLFLYPVKISSYQDTKRSDCGDLHLRLYRFPRVDVYIISARERLEKKCHLYACSCKSQIQFIKKT